MSLAVVEFDPLLDKSYQRTALGPAIVDFLAWKEMGGTRPTTLDSYERALSRGALMFPSTSLEDWSDTQMLHVAKAFTPKQRRVRVAAWRSLFKWARKTRRVTLDPTDALPEMKRAVKIVYDVFIEAEIASLCSLPIRDGALMHLMLYVGPRKGDCRNVRWRDWRPETLEIVFREGKGGKDRIIRVPQVVAQKLSELAILDGLNRDDFLWYTRPGGGKKIERSKAIGDGSFDRWWNRCLDEAGVRYRSPHTTRHTFATRYLRAGYRLEDLSEILGHESIATTYDIYAHLTTQDRIYELPNVLEITPEPIS